ncbi:hypothetical protein QBC45DRAFT_431232 [Copromyces sp. CBS 386.78]|nr:hypothetical protein QBC45DRAFT_431232 [Copromyces sp. CBS 386.78]
MERDQEKTEDLFDLENRLTASLLRTFQSLLQHGAYRVDNTASVGQAAYNAMATDILMNGMIKSVEELLSLTRKMRELWVVGALRKPGEGDEEVEAEMAFAAPDRLVRVKEEGEEGMVDGNGLRGGDRNGGGGGDSYGNGGNGGGGGESDGDGDVDDESDKIFCHVL